MEFIILRDIALETLLWRSVSRCLAMYRGAHEDALVPPMYQTVQSRKVPGSVNLVLLCTIGIACSLLVA
jgi:hypothetical protein